jgi:hypothetical protein
MIKNGVLLISALLLCMGAVTAQETRLVKIPAPFSWPDSESAALRANKFSKDRIRSFIVALVNEFSPPAPENAELPRQVPEFRFVPLEAGKFYLIALTGARVFWSTAVIVPEGGEFRYTELESDGGIPFAMQAVDLAGDGVDELVTGNWPAGYSGATTPAIYWYTVWQFHDGVPEDVSARFPDFYRGFVLAQLWYPEILLRSLQAQDPKATRVPLAEIDYVRLKYQRTILGQANAGLDEALAWARSKVSHLETMGIWSLAEMPSPAAGQELNKLSGSPVSGDLAKLALARRARLLGMPPAQ